MNYIIVSFATKDIPYYSYGKNFEKNMAALNIPYNIEYIEPLTPAKSNERLLNDARKKKDTGRTRGAFLYRKLQEFNSPIVWVDCDDGFICAPSIPDIEFDVGFIKNLTNSKDRLPIMAGLIVLKPTPNAFHFLKVWDYLNAWDELEPVGGSHIRLCYARNICFGKETKNPYKFKEADMTEYFYPCWKLNLNKL